MSSQAPRGVGLQESKRKESSSALLAKLAWMVASKRDNLCMSILRAKYKVKHDWQFSDPPKSASPSWRAIEISKELIVKGTCYLIGDGASINVWTDPWVPWIQGFKPVPKDESLTYTPLSVSHLFDASNHCWNARLIHQLFNEVSAQAILSIPLPYHPKQDKLIWILDSKGRFSVKSAYRVSIAQEPQSDHSDVPWMKLWKARMLERMKMLLWRIGTNSISTKENLSCRLEHIDPVCTLCKSESELCVHLFFECHISRALWYMACWGFRPDQNMVQTFEDIIKLVLEPAVSTLPTYDKWLITLNMAFILEEIWHLQNNILFQDAQIDIPMSSKSVMSRFLEYSKLVGGGLPKPFLKPVIPWLPPPQGWIKINVVTALSSTTAALGVIACNHKGEVIGIWGRCCSLCPPTPS